MKKTYETPCSCTIKLHTENFLAESTNVGVGGDFGDGSGFQTTRRRVWLDDEEE